MNAPDRSITRRTLARRGLPAALLVPLLLAACKDEPPSAPVRERPALAAALSPSAASPPIAALYGTDLLLPLSDSANRGPVPCSRSCSLSRS